MAGGDKVQYDSLKKTDFVEFWDLRDEYEAEIERKINNAKNKK
jgi:hypothetical protein